MPSFPILLPLFLGGGLCIAGGVYGTTHQATVSKEPRPVPHITAPYDDCDDCSEQAMQIAWSLDHQGDEWSSNDFVAHRRAIYIWVGNDDYGIEVGHSHDDVVGAFGWKPTANERRIIWRAYDKWHESVRMKATDFSP